MPWISDLGKVPFSVAATGKALATGNYDEAVANGVLSVGQLGWAVGKYHAGKKWEAEFKGEVYLLELGIQLVQALTILHGSATDKGQYYQLGSDDLQLAYENLKDAVASEGSWSGSGADAYNACVDQLMTQSLLLADLDTKIAAILDKQSGQVGDARMGLTYCRATLTAAIPVAVAMRWANPSASWLFQIVTFTAVMTSAFAVTLQMLIDAGDNGIEIDGLAEQYRAVANAVTPISEAIEPSAAAPAQKTTFGQFESPAGAAPETAIPSGMAASVGSPASAERPAASMTVEGADAEDVSPAGTPPGDPLVTTAPSTGAAASYSPTAAAASQPGTSAAPRRPEAPAAPTATVDEDEDEDDTATASSGAEGERAPVDAAVRGSDQTVGRVQ